MLLFATILPTRCCRPTSSRPPTDKFAGAVATVNFLNGEGLFNGQKPDFLHFLMNLAVEADAARRSI
jgi:hypothetical protein